MGVVYKEVCIFIFKQKTAYEVEYGLVGSEMCIRDRVSTTDCGRRRSAINASMDWPDRSARCRK